MVPPADPKKLKDMKYNPQIIEELDELGILNDISDFVFANPEASIPTIQRYAVDKHGYTDLGNAEIEFLRHGYQRVPVGNGRGARKRRVNKTIKDTLKNDFSIIDEENNGGNDNGNKI